MGARMTIPANLQKKLQATKMKFALERAVKQTMYDLMKETMKLAPEDTGNLRRSHSVDMRLSSSMIEGLLKNSANYWVYQNFGTSKMPNPKCKNFVGRAFQKIQPGKRVAKYFKEYNK